MLADKISHYKATGKMLQTTPAQYKDEFPWLREVDSLALCNAQLQVQTAYKNFFRDKSIGFPKFRSKKSSRKAYTTNAINGNISVKDGCLKLPKMGLMRVKFHRQIPDNHKIKSVTFSQEASGKYYVSILTEYETDGQAPKLNIDKTIEEIANSSGLSLDEVKKLQTGQSAYGYRDQRFSVPALCHRFSFVSRPRRQEKLEIVSVPRAGVPRIPCRSTIA